MSTTPPPTPILTLHLPHPLPTAPTSTHLHIRPYTPTDAPSLALAANSPAIARNMRNTFPHPYHLSDAESFIAHACDKGTWVGSGEADIAVGAGEEGRLRKEVWEGKGEKVPVNYAVVLVGENQGDRVIGGVGLKFRNPADVEARNAEVGYWLAEEFWGNALTSIHLAPFTRWTFATFPFLLRLEASVFGWNNARSGACLRKAGFVEVARLRGKVWKWGKGTDEVVWVCLRGEI